MDSRHATKRSAEPAISQQRAAKRAACAKAATDNSIASVSVSQGSTTDYNKIMNCCSATKCSAHLAEPTINQEKADDGRAVTDVMCKDSGASDLADNYPMFQSTAYSFVDIMKDVKDMKELVYINRQKLAEIAAKNASNARALANWMRKSYIKQKALLSNDSISHVLRSSLIDWKSSVVDDLEQLAVEQQEYAELAAKRAADKSLLSREIAQITRQELGRKPAIDNIP